MMMMSIVKSQHAIFFYKGIYVTINLSIGLLEVFHGIHKFLNENKMPLLLFVN